MKRFVGLICLASLSGIMLATDVTPEQLAKNRARKRERIQQLTGGWIIIRQENAGQFTFVNAQKKVPSAEFDSAISDMEKFLSIDVVVEPGAWDGETGKMGTVYIIDNPVKPALVVVPEEGWGIVNVAKLGDENLASRTRKEMWRALAFICGAADTSIERCLLKPIFKPEDLDRQLVDTISPEPLLKMDSHIRRMGIKQHQRITYRQAAERGIAPVPTNEYQRVIWEQVNGDKERGPTKTRPIKFKGKRPPRP